MDYDTYQDLIERMPQSYFTDTIDRMKRMLVEGIPMELDGLPAPRPKYQREQSSAGLRTFDLPDETSF